MGERYNHNNIKAFPARMPLDNAAKIYPPARGRKSPSMFRLSMELTEVVDSSLLETALKRTLNRMPSFSQRLRRGFFWYHLEHTDDIPPISDEIKNPCVYLNVVENNGFQFRVSCYKNRIAVDFFHVLTDGTGGMSFIKTLVAEYITLRFCVHIPRGEGILDCDEAPCEAEYEDSFLRYAKPMKISRLEPPAYHIRGTREEYGVLYITTGIIPLEKISAKAKEYGATINEFLSALLIRSICDIQRDENDFFRKRQPVKVCIPINLRKRFPSCTLRNFTSYVNLGVSPILGDYSLEEIITGLKHGMALEGNDKMLAAKFSTNVASEKHPLLKIAPLLIKDPVMKLYYVMNGDRYNSATLSNLGLVKLPEEMGKYVERVSFMLGAAMNPVACACVGFENKLCFNIARTIKEPLVEKRFFRALAEMGIHITLESNQR